MAVITPEHFLARIAKQPLAPAYLFLGPEGFYRRRCKEALLTRALSAETRADGLTQVDLEDLSVAEVLDDARSLSLFASERVVWVTSAELALPRRVTAEVESDDEPGKPAESGLSSYLREPTPGTTLVFECSRFDFSGDDKPKLDRVQKFYSSISVTVEFHPLTPESSRYLAQDLAKQHGLKIGGPELALLLEACAGDASSLANEIEKLSLFVENARAVTADDVRTLTPNAAQSTIFALVNALGKRDRPAALRSLDILVREGEYLPLALTFLNTQFRLALAAKEARVNSVQQSLSFFAKLGVRMWRDRAEQVMGTAGAFTKERLEQALTLIYATDKKMREGYKDDRLIMESLVLSLTSIEKRALF